MNLITPTTVQVADNIVAQLQTSFNATIPLLPKSFVNVLAKVLAGVYVILYKYAGFSLLQQFVSTASFNETTVGTVKLRPLVEWGKLIGIGEPNPATNAELSITITVTTQSGTIAVNTLLQGANGITYMTLAGVALNAATVNANVRAVQDQTNGGGAGAIGNLPNGSTLTFLNPQVNVLPNTVVASTLLSAEDAESEVAYRQRVVNRFQKRPQGGALVDWEMWCNEVSGVKNTYPYAGVPGEVDLYIESVAGVDGIADGALLTAVNSHLTALRPVSSFPNPMSITRKTFDVEVVGLTVNDIPTTETQIETALTEYFLSREPYIFGLSLAPRKDRISVTEVTAVVSDVVNANGGVFNNCIVKYGATVVTVYNLVSGEKAKFGVLL